MSSEITFRPPTIHDHNLIQGIWEDPATMEAVGGVWPMNPDEHARWLDSMTVTHADTNCYYPVFWGGECVGEADNATSAQRASCSER